MTVAGAGPLPAPEPSDPGGDAERLTLWTNVRAALYALPSRFESPLNVSGVLATDLFAFNASLGASIEQQVVDELNELRESWDPDQRWAPYRFERQPQSFPDVVLRTPATGLDHTPILGIELKGWYALAKEREPSFRYVVTPGVPTEYDLLVVYPWALSAVVSGSPKLFDPWIAGARFAAEYRNWHWQHQRQTTSDASVRVSTFAGHYPAKSDAISDHAAADDGGNFGRVARTELMDAWLAIFREQRLSGIPIDAWQRFFHVFADTDWSAGLDRVVARLRASGAAQVGGLTDEQLAAIVDAIRESAKPA